MKSEQQQYQMAFRRAISFVKERPALTEDTTTGGTALGNGVTALEGVVQRMTTCATSQQTFASAMTLVARDEDSLQRDLIQQHLRPIAMLARGLNGQVPGIGILKMPSSRLSKLHLIETATAFARKAEVYRDTLIEHGMPTDGIEQLDAAIEAFRNSIDARSTSRANLKGATRGVMEEIAIGRKIVSMLDGVLLRMLHNQPAEIVVWRAAKRLSRASTSGQSPTPLVVPVSVAVQHGAADGQKAA